MATWLNEPDAGLLPSYVSVQLPPLPTPVGDDRVSAVSLGDDPDPLVAVPAVLQPAAVYRRLPIDGASDIVLLREGLLKRLLTANEQLPEGFSLTVLDGWRSTSFQSALLGYYREQTGERLDQYVADPDDQHVVPPHTTGGAVDLTLSHQGVALALGSDFDEFTPAAHLLTFEHLDTSASAQQRQVRDLRRLLGSVLSAVGLAPYPIEWWHWSFGDQRWAAQHGLATSLYSTTDLPPATAPA